MDQSIEQALQLNLQRFGTAVPILFALDRAI
jgi:hypothetical protein